MSASHSSSKINEKEWYIFIRQSILYYIHNARSITTVSECLLLIYDVMYFVLTIVRKYVIHRSTAAAAAETEATATATATHTDSVSSKRSSQNSDSDVMFYQIATTNSALYVYCVVAVSMILHQIWIVVYGLLLFIVFHVLICIMKWIHYILDDRELYENYKYIRSWCTILLHEGEDMVRSDAAWKLATVLMMIDQAPTGISYIRYVIRYKTRLLRKQFIMELGGNRYYYDNARQRIQGTVQKLKSSFVSSSQATIDDTSLGFHKSIFDDTNDDGHYYEEIWYSNSKDNYETVLQHNSKKRR